VKTVAFIGLGVMGRPMSGNLARAGFSLKTFDLRTRGRCKSIREAAQGADVLITMLPDGAAVREAVLEALPVLRKGAIVIDTSSCDPAGTRALGTALHARGVEMLDAPVSGAVVGAREASLTFMVGGADAAFKKIRPLLRAMGKQIFHVGPLGAGHAVKALNNYLGAAGTLAGFEALLVARAFGLAPEPMLAAINASTGRNSTTERKIARDILTGTFGSGFRLALMAKDVAIAAQLARGLRVRTPFLRHTLATWRKAQAALPPGADHVEIYRYQEAVAAGRRTAQRARRPARSARGRAGRKSAPGFRD
jgi:3-hydroxyisobutyrate dehydrogenase